MITEFMLNELGPINTRNCISDLLNRQTEGPTTVEGSWEITLDGDLNLSYYTLVSLPFMLIINFYEVQCCNNKHYCINTGAGWF